MKVITTHEFKHTLRDIHKNTERRRFCYVIGAGSSRNSGIPTGGELSEKWFSEINDRLELADFENWVAEKKVDKADLASSYGTIYRKRFENDKTSGYEFLVKEMKNAKPSFGHHVLAQMLSRSPGHCVLTTNFDSLIESSVYQFTNKTPLVCGHESLSGYARPSDTHPLIIKIHRDLLLSPKSDPDEINKLDPVWEDPLNAIFSTHIPIVIGYGGNDGSLMSYFESRNKLSNFFWCGLDENNISSRIKKLVDKHEGIFVKIEGFDELMHELLWVFDEIGPIDKELSNITDERVLTVKKWLSEFDNTEIIETDNKAITGNAKMELSALEYSNLADKEPDLEKRKSIYIEAIDKYRTTGWLWLRFTYFLHFIKRDFEDLDLYYQTALELNNNENYLFGNYALYLNEIKKDYIEAEKYYIKCTSVKNPTSTHCNNYALFLKDIKKEYDKAEKFFLKALTIDPNNVWANVGYALYLSTIKKDHKKAEEFYLKVLTTIDENNAIANGNYAQILLWSNELESADTFLKRAFDNVSDQENSLLIELWFYRYAHYIRLLNESEGKVEELLKLGIKSIGWDLDENVKVAIKNKHPYPDKLKELARRITEE